MRRICCVGVTLVLALAGGLAAQDAPRKMEIDDGFRLQRVGSPQLSPDGKWVAYTVGTTDLEKDRNQSRVWMVATAGGDALPMTMEGMSAGSPRFSPDGRWLTFTASRNDEKTQVWALDRRGGEAQPLTSVKQGVNGYLWSPDGKRLLLSITDPEPTPEDSAAAKEEKEKDEKKPFIIDRLQFKQDNVGYLNRLRDHYYVYDPGSKTLQQITDGDYDDGAAAWSPDGRHVAFVSKRMPQADSSDNTDVWIVDVPSSLSADGAVPAPRQLTTNPGADGSPAWSADGKSIAYVTDTRPDLIWYAVNQLAVIPAAGGEPRVLTPELDRNVSDPEYDSKGRIWFNLEDSGAQQLARIGADGRGFERVVAGESVVASADVGRSGDVVMLISDPQHPFEVYKLGGRGPERLTHANDDFIAGLTFGAVENIHSHSADGTEIEGWVTLPPDYEEGHRYPVLLQLHGGPVAQFDWSFDFDSQLFAANGYVVVRANPRGSSGYGQDFSAAIFADWGEKPVADVMSALDEAITTGYADPDHMGVGGWSYGGILTNYVITSTDRFEGAITGASEVLYRSNYGHDHYQHVWEAELGLPWGPTAENWEKISPFNKVENITTPTLIMGGSIDWNVPILNSEQLYQALKRLGRPALLVVYPGEHHGFRNPAFIKDRYQRFLDWYDLYVKGDLAEPRANWEGSLARLRAEHPVHAAVR